MNREQPEPLFCAVGDEVEFIRAVVPTPWEGELVAAVSVGDRYKAIRLVGSGWDLERVRGSGPAELRLLNSQMKEYVKVAEE